MELNEKLIQLRKKKGITQAELAEDMQVSRQAVSKWESGGSIPSIENLRSLSELYNVHVDYLLKEDGEKEEEEPVLQEPTDNPETSTNSKRNVGLKWCIAALMALVLVVLVGIIIANGNKEHLRLGEAQGEEVVSDRNFSLGW